MKSKLGPSPTNNTLLITFVDHGNSVLGDTANYTQALSFFSQHCLKLSFITNNDKLCPLCRKDFVFVQSSTKYYQINTATIKHLSCIAKTLVTLSLCNVTRDVLRFPVNVYISFFLFYQIV